VRCASAIALEELGLAVQREHSAWPDPDRPLVAGVSSFGMGGTNAHIVVAEPPAAREPDPAEAQGTPLAVLPWVVTGHSEPALAVARRAIREAIDVTRRMVGGLHDQTVLPPLPRVLREFAGTAPEAVDVRFRTTGDERLLSDACRRELFLTPREAMSNAFRHSGARQVTVTMRFTRRWAHARIVGTGIGFDTDDVLAPGFCAPGLRSMTDRIEDLGGRLTIASEPASGTRVDVHLPLRPGA
jgi:hypothetical protein